jgi:hypothetical protein
MAVVTSAPWSSSPDAVAGAQHRTLDSIFNTQVIFGRGGRTDDLSAYYDMAGYRRMMGPAGYTSGGYNRSFVGSGMAETNFGGRNTPTGSSTVRGPGGYNWQTLERNLDRAVTGYQNAREFRKERKVIAKQKADQDAYENLQNMHNAYTAAYGFNPLKAAYDEAEAREQAALGAQSLNSLRSFATQTMTESQNATAELRFGNQKVVAGAAAPIKGRKGAPIDLLNPPSSQPASKKSARNPGVKKPKSTAPAIKPPVPPII